MSRKATDWAWSVNIRPATLKLVLLSMADRADEHHCCYPSIERLVRDTSLNKKTIQAGIKTLSEMGLIRDTGERKGATQRVRVFKLSITDKCDRKRDDSKIGNIPEIGTLNVPEIGKLNVPEIGMQNQSVEPVIEPKAKVDSVNGCSEVQEVMEFWKSRMGKPKAKLTTDRRSKIRSRLKEGYSVDEIKQAITGCASSEFHMGKNDGGKVHNDITLILRTGSKLEQFKEMAATDDSLPWGGAL